MIHIDDNGKLAHLSDEHMTTGWLLIADVLLERLAPLRDGMSCTLFVTRFDEPVIREALTQLRERYLEIARAGGTVSNEAPSGAVAQETEKAKLCYVKHPYDTTGCLLPRGHKGKHRDVEGSEWRPSADETRYGE